MGGKYSPNVLEAEVKFEGFSRLSSFSVQHFNQQVVAGHIAVQMFVVKVFFSLQADGSDLW